MIINAVCEKEEQAEALSGIGGIRRIFHPKNIMPYIFRNGDAASCKDFLSESYLLVRNIDEIGYLEENGYTGEIFADHTLYSFNSAARDMLKSFGALHDTAPLELNYRELSARGMSGSELMIYGRVPMMISAGCLYKNTHENRCKRNDRGGHDILLTDRTDTCFPVICDCRYCCNIILNSVPLSLHGHTDKIRELAPGSVRLYFTTENGRKTRQTAEYFIAALKGGDDPGDPPYMHFTNGHFIKGIV